MNMVEIAVWLVAGPFLLLSLWVAQKLKVLTPPRRRLIAALSIPVVILTFTFWLASDEWLLAIPVAILLFSFILLLGAYTWKVDEVSSELAKRILDHNPTIEDRFQRSAILSKLIKRRKI